MELTHQRRFHVRYCLGRGGFGEVYRATMESPGGLKTEVALKVLRLDLGPNGDAVRRLRDEGRLLAALDHPVILRAYDLALLDGRVGLVTEFVNGEDLAAIVGGTDPLPPRALVQVIGAIAEALHAAWTNRSPETGEPMRLVHRDIKPSNIRIGTHGEVKLLDFGIARSEQVDREAQTGTGSAIGSLPYMAPERFSRNPAAPPADVYGLGCTLYEGLARRRLFPEAAPVDMFRFAADHRVHFQHVQDALDRLALDPELAGLLAVMLAHDPAERPTAREVALVCEDLAERLPGGSLKRWARDHAWPDAESVAGHFEGRTLTEGTLETSELARTQRVVADPSATFALDLPDETVVSPVASRRPSVAALAIGALAVVGALALAGVLFGSDPAEPAVSPQVRAAVAEQPPTPDIAADEPPERISEDPADVAVVAPEPPADVPADVPTSPDAADPGLAAAPAPVAPAPAVVMPSPEPVAAPPDPAVVTPEPDPEPAAPEPVGTGTVALATRGVRIELRSAGVVHGPGEVPVGRYDLWADFGTGMLQRGRVDVVVGRAVTIRCNTLTYGCDVED